MKTLESHEKSVINQLVAEYIHEKAIIFSDQSTSYTDFENLVEMHISQKSVKENTCKLISMSSAINSTGDTLVKKCLTG